MTENNPAQAETDVEQHSLVRSIVLHLLPGVFIFIFYAITAPLMEGLGHPSGTALFIAIGVVLIPFELGYLLYQGKKRNGTFSLKGIVLYREPMPWWQYILLGLPLFLWLGVVFMILAPPIDEVIINSLFSWVPDWFFLFDIDTVDQYSQSALLVVAILNLTLNGIAGPVVEELYFRSYLLPRLSRFGKWAPLIDTLLFWWKARNWHDTMFNAANREKYLLPGDEVFYWAGGLGYQHLRVRLQPADSDATPPPPAAGDASE